MTPKFIKCQLKRRLKEKIISVLVAKFKFGPDSLVNLMKCLVIQFNSNCMLLSIFYYVYVDSVQSTRILTRTCDSSIPLYRHNLYFSDNKLYFME